MGCVFEAKFPQTVEMQSCQTRRTSLPVNAHISEVIFKHLAAIHNVNPILLGYNLMAPNQALAPKSLACCHLRPSLLSCEGLSC